MAPSTHYQGRRPSFENWEIYGGNAALINTPPRVIEHAKFMRFSGVPIVESTYAYVKNHPER